MTMLSIDDLCPLLPLFQHKLLTIDSLLIYLLSTLTTSLLMITSLLMTSFQVFGTPIRCQGSSDMTSEFIEEYCWSTSTFSTLSSRKYEPVYPGVGPSITDKEKLIYHNYYQFMPVVLLFLAGVCMTPRIIWRYWEGGLMAKLVPIKDDKVDVNIVSWVKAKSYGKNLSNYFVRNLHSRQHMRYGWFNLVAEVMCLLSVLLVIVVLQCIFKTFLQYFPLYVFHHFVAPLPISPEERLFPTQSKCTIHNFGPSGTIQTQDTLCILTVNLINQKLFLVIWVWLVLLLITTFFLLSNSIMTALMPSFRRSILANQAGLRPPPSVIFTKIDRLCYGEWLLLSRVSSHFTSDVVDIILTEVCDIL